MKVTISTELFEFVESYPVEGYAMHNRPEENLFNAWNKFYAEALGNGQEFGTLKLEKVVNDDGTILLHVVHTDSEDFEEVFWLEQEAS